MARIYYLTETERKRFEMTPDSFILTTPKLEKTDQQIEHTIGKYSPQAEFISVIDLLHSVQIKTDFLDSFKHYSLQNISVRKLEPNLLYDSIVGYGCNITLSKMAKISKYNMKSSIDSTNAGWSHKYLGLDQGVSVTHL